jgi:hypothetical protein
MTSLLIQEKLTKSEWISTEIPVSSAELDVLTLLMQGVDNLNVRINRTLSLCSFLKIEPTEVLHSFLFSQFLAPRVRDWVTQHGWTFVAFESDGARNPRGKPSSTATPLVWVPEGKLVRLNSSDQIRVGRLSLADVLTRDSPVYEVVLMDWMSTLAARRAAQDPEWMHAFFVLTQLMKNQIQHFNPMCRRLLTDLLAVFEPDVDLSYVLTRCPTYFESTPALWKYQDLTLYAHQKDLIRELRSDDPKLILYVAPTGTGKTLSPLALSMTNRVVFVCAARHVGLALARAAVSVRRRVAFAFGCTTASDVRLHFSAAKEYTTHSRSGQIHKVDNLVGDNVDLMICDVRSYLVAMHYMASFNPLSSLVAFWDEPTITLDCPHHELHDVLHRNWVENLIPRVVLSSATLPREADLPQTLESFQTRFPDASVVSLVTHDCRKSITLLDPNGYVVGLHSMEHSWETLQAHVAHCQSNPTLWRYFDLREVVDTTDWMLTHLEGPSSPFVTVTELTIESIKAFYLRRLAALTEPDWRWLQAHVRESRRPRLAKNPMVNEAGDVLSRAASWAGSNPTPLVTERPLARLASVSGPPSIVLSSVEAGPVPEGWERVPCDPGSCGMFLLTKDAYTLTDGPTLFLATDLAKVATFCVQQARIPESVMRDIEAKIQHNEVVQKAMEKKEQELEDEENKLATGDDSHKGASDPGATSKGKVSKQKAKQSGNKADREAAQLKNVRLAALREGLLALQALAKPVGLNELFIPNRRAHVDKWAPGLPSARAFTSQLSEDVVVRIMLLGDVDPTWKVLLLLGVGVFADHRSVAYKEIMKTLADEQKLFVIIAHSDFIFGMNYQFCHAYLSKDLVMTPEKTIQSFGRVGRNDVQVAYTLRLRDPALATLLFSPPSEETRVEARLMNRLFSLDA